MNELDEQGLSITDKIIRPAEGEKVKLEHCPFCQGTEYYTKVFMKGPVKYIRKFSNDSEDGVDNSDMYDLLNEVYSCGYIYCNNCNRRICRIEDYESKVDLR